MFGKKKTLGIQPKTRTLDQINQDYNHHAAQAGHKTRIIAEIQGEIDQHVDCMLRINEEAKAIPPAPKPEPAPEPEVPAAATLDQETEHA